MPLREGHKQRTDPSESVHADLSQRIRIIRFTLAGAYILGIALSYPLWITDRQYPLTPIFSYLPQIPPPFDEFLVWIFCVLLAAQAFIPQKRVFVLLALSCALIIAVSDQSRWHPWFYQYTFILAALTAIPYSKKHGSSNTVVNALQVMMVGMYLWGGLHKLNSSFYNEVVPMMFGEWLSPDVLTFIAPILPMVEILIGICLLFPRTRLYAFIVAVIMHVSIIAALGPTGHNINTVILPWNIAVIILLYILFKTKETVRIRTRFPGTSILERIAFLLFIILPVFNTLGLWDSYLSFALYSGNTNAVTYYIDSEGRDKLPTSIRNFTEPYDGKVFRIDIVKWTNTILHAPIYPEKRIFESVARYVARSLSQKGKLTMIVHERRTIFANTPSVVKQYP